ncbi:U3 small nucleolar RNA-associated protein 25 [Nakaseomyces bracarensis]|uniref:U3 small nucleolar RNA-associated protein 25 n=1 Tax=Nakaseomyces bracarensis TaxID=273131 RepID=A0ABR4NWZ8_9SACH
MDGKRGRKEMRSIRRAGGSKRAKYDELNAEETGEGVVTEVGRADEVEDEQEVDEEDEDTGKEQVYNALLTILKSEHKEEKKRKPERVEEESTMNEEMDEEEQIDEAFAEEDEEEEEDDDENEDDDELDSDDEERDPFDTHFNNTDSALVDQLSSAFDKREIKYRSIKKKITESEEAIFSVPRKVGDTEPIQDPTIKNSIGSYFLKKRLRIHNNLMDSKADSLTKLQKKLVDPMFQYKDILYQYDSYEKDEDEYRELYALHVLNHVYKTRDKIIKNNQKLQDNPDVELLDQGFTRPKVLIIAPTRDAAYHIVSKIIDKSGLDQVDKKGKFKDQFYDSSFPPNSKPKSFQHVFKGNTNDFFVLGVKFTRKAIKLYSNFYQSDIIVCSPLGLQMIVENTDKKKRQDDFLSSVEVTIIDQFHSIEYQNYTHLFTIFEHLNKIPTQQHDADFSRIRMWYINEQAKLFRQTMIFTKYTSPTANSLLNIKCKNIEGKWKNHKLISSDESSIGSLGLKVRQIFQRFTPMSNSVADEPDYRFKFFTSVIIPNITKTTGYDDGTLIYIPEYSDYIRVRNYLKDKTSILFGDINEYSEQRQLTSNRSLFNQGRIKVLLYTERLHHYRRYEIKGVKNVVFYKPPGDPEFYKEVVRFIGKTVFLGNADLNISTVRCCYSKIDGLALEKIVGTKRAGVLTHGQNEVYEFK